MSAKTWLKEFYPKPANKTKKSEAVQRSIKKWEGLQKTHLKRHKVYHCDGTVIDEVSDIGVIEVDAESCSLCFHYFKACNKNSCRTCPLYKVRDNVSCCDARADEGADEGYSPLDAMIDDDNPKPMLKWLKKALRMLKV